MRHKPSLLEVITSGINQELEPNISLAILEHINQALDQELTPEQNTKYNRTIKNERQVISFYIGTRFLGVVHCSQEHIILWLYSRQLVISEIYQYEDPNSIPRLLKSIKQALT